MQEMLQEFMGEYGSLAVFLLILLENLFPPVPSEVILTFGGFMTTCTHMRPVSVITASTLGSVAGAGCLYLAGRFLPASVLKHVLAGPVGRILGFHPEDVELAADWFLKKGRAAVFVCRLMPIVRSLISIPAGISRMPLIPFFILTAAGSLLWNTALVYAGRAAGSSWEAVSEALGTYSDIFLMVLGGGVAAASAAMGVRRRRREKQKAEKQ